MSYTTYLRWGVVSALFLALFVPFVIADGGNNVHGFYIPFTNLFFPFITGKNFLFRILVELGLVCYVLLALREPKYRPQVSTIFWTSLAFVGWMAVATIFSVDPVKSFWSNFERMEGYVSLLHMFVWFVMAGSVLSVGKLWDRLFNVSIFLSGVMGFNALLQIVGLAAISSQSGPRVDTTFGNATYLAVYLLIHVFLTLYMLARTRSVGLQSLYGIALVLQVMGLYYTETRGAVLGLLGGLIIAMAWVVAYWLYSRARGKRFEHTTLAYWSLGGLVAIALLVGGFFAVKDTSLVERSNTLKRLSDISLEDRTTQSRFIIWNMAFEGAKEKPLTGWGQENFNFVFNEHYSPAMYDQEQWFDRAHNEFLDWLIAGGIPAFVLYIALYGIAVWVILRSDMSVPEQAAFLGLMGGYAFNNIFVFDNLVSAMYFWLLLAYFHSLSVRKVPSLVWSRPMGDHTLAIAAPVVAGVLLVGGWALNVPGLARASGLVNALQTQVPITQSDGSIVGASRNPKENLDAFNRALGVTAWPGTPQGRQEATEQLLQFATNLAPQQNVDLTVKRQVLERAYNAGTQLLEERKGDARLELFFATFLGAAGATGEAMQHLEAALALSPQKQQIYIQIGMTKLQSGDTEGALVAIKQAFDLEPHYDTARLFYAAALYSAGRTASADALLTERYGTAVVDDEQLLQLYVNLKLYDRAAAVWQARIAKDPNNVQLHLGLASMYFNAGREAETIAELRKIIQIQPTAAAEMEQLISQIQSGALKPN